MHPKAKLGLQFLGYWLLAAWLGLAAAAAEPDPAQHLGEQMMTYYQHPAPDKFVDMVKSLVLLEKMRGNRPDQNVMFLGKIMAQNPAKIAGWMDELAFLEDLMPNDAAVLQRAAWYSGTIEAKAWLKAHGHADLAAKEPPPLLGSTPMTLEPYHLDMLWEWFFATGEDAPVRRIIALFRLAPSAPLPNSLELPQQPAATADRGASEISLANFRIVHAAVWSTASNAATHQRVWDLLQKTSADPALDPMQQAWVRQALRIAKDWRNTP